MPNVKSFIVVLFVLTPLICFAAQPAGEVPIVEPLFPPPPMQSPNYSGNINSSVGTAPETGTSTSGADLPGQSAAALGENPGTEVSQGTLSPKKASRHVPWVWIVVGICLAAVAAVYRKGRYAGK